MTDATILGAIIRDRAADTTAFGLLPAAADRVQMHRVSPTCGDALAVQLEIAEGAVVAVRWEGRGCELSRAAAALLADILPGLGLDEAQRVVERYLGASTDSPVGDDESMTEAMELASAPLAPLRRRCARLAWQAASELLSGADGAVA